MSGDGARGESARGGLTDREAIERICMRNLIANSEERVFFKDRESRFLLVSDGWIAAQAPGMTAEEVIGKTDFDIFSVEHAAAALADEQEILRTGAAIVAKVERETFPDRADVWVSTTKMPLRADDNEIIGTFGISRDITAQVHLERELTHQALHDALTGLANRLALLDRLRQAIRTLGRQRGRVAVFFIDLDGFKGVNDALGHDKGDQALVDTAARLRAIARPSDTVARIGGDEFVVLLPSLPEGAHVEAIAARIVAGIAQPHHPGSSRPTVTASVGVASTRDPRYDADLLLQEADAAMYQAKRQGRDRFCIARGVPARTDVVERAPESTFATPSGVSPRPQSP